MVAVAALPVHEEAVAAFPEHEAAVVAVAAFPEHAPAVVADEAFPLRAPVNVCAVTVLPVAVISPVEVIPFTLISGLPDKPVADPERAPENVGAVTTPPKYAAPALDNTPVLESVAEVKIPPLVPTTRLLKAAFDPKTFDP